MASPLDEVGDYGTQVEEPPPPPPPVQPEQQPVAPDAAPQQSMYGGFEDQQAAAPAAPTTIPDTSGYDQRQIDIANKVEQLQKTQEGSHPKYWIKGLQDQQRDLVSQSKVIDAQRRADVNAARQAAAQQRQVEQQNRFKASDLAARGVPTFRDANGGVGVATDSTGAPLTKLDKSHGIAYDSSGQPQKLEYGPTGPPKVSDPFANLPSRTDPDTGEQYQVAPGLPWKWTGTDQNVKNQRMQEEKDKAVAQESKLLGTKLSMDHADYVAGNKEHDLMRKELIASVPTLQDPRLAGADLPTVQKAIEDHFNTEYGAPEANETNGWFSKDLSPSAQSLRDSIDKRKADAMDTAQNLFDLKDKQQALGEQIQTNRQLRQKEVDTLIAHQRGQSGPLDQQPAGATPDQTDQAQPAAPQMPPNYGPEQAPGMLERGNIDYNTRPVVQNDDGTTSTVKSFSIDTPKGEVLLPSIADDGHQMSHDEAVQQYEQTGKHLGIFAGPKSADAFAEAHHMEMGPPEDQANLTPDALKQATQDGTLPPHVAPAAVATSHDIQDANQKADALQDSNPSAADEYRNLAASMANGLAHGVRDIIQGGIKAANRYSPLGLAKQVVGFDQSTDDALANKTGDLASNAILSSMRSTPGAMFSKAITGHDITELDDRLKDTVGTKVGNFIGGAVPYVATSLLAPEVGVPLTVSTLFSSGFNNTYEGAKSRGVSDDKAQMLGLASGAINGILGLPFKGVGAALGKVFGGTAPKVIADAVVKSFTDGVVVNGERLVGREGFNAYLQHLADGVRIGVMPQSVKAEAMEGIQQLGKELFKTPAQRALDVGKTALGHAAIGGGVQTAQNIVTKQYDPETGLFQGVPEQALGFGVLGGLSKGFEQVARAREAKQALDSLHRQAGPPPPVPPSLGGPQGPQPPPVPPEFGGEPEKPAKAKVVEGEKPTTGGPDVSVQTPDQEPSTEQPARGGSEETQPVVQPTEGHAETPATEAPAAETPVTTTAGGDTTGPTAGHGAGPADAGTDTGPAATGTTPATGESVPADVEHKVEHGEHAQPGYTAVDTAELPKPEAPAQGEFQPSETTKEAEGRLWRLTKDTQPQLLNSLRQQFGGHANYRDILDAHIEDHANKATGAGAFEFGDIIHIGQTPYKVVGSDANSTHLQSTEAGRLKQPLIQSTEDLRKNINAGHYGLDPIARQEQAPTSETATQAPAEGGAAPSGPQPAGAEGAEGAARPEYQRVALKPLRQRPGISHEPDLSKPEAVKAHLNRLLEQNADTLARSGVKVTLAEHDAPSGFKTDPTTGAVVIDPNKLAVHAPKIAEHGGDPAGWITSATQEEHWHGLQIKAHGEDFRGHYGGLHSQLGEEDKKRLELAYPDDKDPAYQGAELQRMIMQDRAGETITEAHHRDISGLLPLITGTQTPEMESSIQKILHASEPQPQQPEVEPKTVDEAAGEAKPEEATDAQLEAGNYQKGHIAQLGGAGGLEVAIENSAGTKRKPEWPALHSHYGYIKGTKGVDKDHVDVFIKQGTPMDWKGPVYVIDQTKPDGKFDEHKVVIGVHKPIDAIHEYQQNYDAAHKDNYKGITEFKNIQEFKNDWMPFAQTGPAALSPAEEATFKPGGARIDNPYYYRRPGAITEPRGATPQHYFKEYVAKARPDLGRGSSALANALIEQWDETGQIPEVPKTGTLTPKGPKKQRTGTPEWALAKAPALNSAGKLPEMKRNARKAMAGDIRITADRMKQAGMIGTKEEQVILSLLRKDFPTQLALEQAARTIARHSKGVTDASQEPSTEGVGVRGEGGEVGEGAPLRQPRPATGEGETQEEEKPESAGPSGGVSTLEQLRAKLREQEKAGAVDDRLLQQIRELEAEQKPKKPVTPQVPAMEGMTPLGQPKKVEGIKPVTLDEQARKDLGDALEGLMASVPTPKPTKSLKMHAIYHALVEKGQPVEKVAREFSMKPHHIEAIYDAMRSPRPRMALMASEPFAQKDIPDEKLDAFVKAAKSMLRSGVSTPEALAQVMPPASHPYLQAMWDAFGMVKGSLRGTHDWPKIVEGLKAETAPEIAPEPEIGARVKIVVKGETFIGLMQISAGLKWIEVKNHSPITLDEVSSIEQVNTADEVRAERQARKMGKIAYTQPKTRDDYENTLWDLAGKVADHHIAIGEPYNQEKAMRHSQLEAQFDKVADEIELAKAKRRYLLSQAINKREGKPLQRAHRLGSPYAEVRVPKPQDFDPDKAIRAKRWPRPLTDYMTKAEVEASLKSAQDQLKGKPTKIAAQMAQNVIDERTRQLEKGDYLEAAQERLKTQEPAPEVAPTGGRPRFTDPYGKTYTLYGWATDIKKVGDIPGGIRIGGSGWEWYVFSPIKGDILEGYVHGFEDEWGSFTQSELKENGIKLHTDPKELADVAPPVGWKVAEPEKPKKPKTPQVPAITGMTPLGQPKKKETNEEISKRTGFPLDLVERTMGPDANMPQDEFIQRLKTKLVDIFKVDQGLGHVTGTWFDAGLSKGYKDKGGGYSYKSGEAYISARGITITAPVDSIRAGNPQFTVTVEGKTEKPAKAKTVGSWKAEIDDGSGYASNGLRFATKEEAEKSGRAVFNRWMAAKEMRVVESNEAPTHTWNTETGHAEPIIGADVGGAMPKGHEEVRSAVATRLLIGQKFPRTELTALAEEHGLSAKQADEAAEAGIVQAATDMQASRRSATPQEIFDRLVEMYNNQPNLTARTATSKLDQAYSTPVPLAFVASQLADIKGGKKIYEPTAGNGMLLIEADPSKQQVFANELNDQRAAELMSQKIKVVTMKDASEWHPNIKADREAMNPPFGTVQEDGKTKTFIVDGVTTTQIDHAIVLESLKSLADDGRAVLIMGGPGTNTGAIMGDPKARREWYAQGQRGDFWKRLYAAYGVIDHFTVDGELYKKQGAGWPVDVVLIKGRGESPIQLPSANAPRILTSWDDLKNELARTDDERVTAGTLTPEQAAGQVSGVLGAIRKLRKPSEGSEQPQHGEPTVPGLESGGSVTGAPPTAGKLPVPAPRGRHEAGGTTAAGPAGGEGVRSPDDEHEQRGRLDQAQSDLDNLLGGLMASEPFPEPLVQKDMPDEKTTALLKAARSMIAAGVTTPEKLAEMVPPAAHQYLQAIWDAMGMVKKDLRATHDWPKIVSGIKPTKPPELDPSAKLGSQGKDFPEPAPQYRVPYKPKSQHNSFSILTPTNLELPQREALNKQFFEESIDNYVMRKIGYSDKEAKAFKELYFSAEQIDALGLAIKAAETQPNPLAFILGDQGGIGKGRVAAGMMLYAMQRGWIPVFFTKDVKLYAAMINDLYDVGRGHLVPLITNNNESFKDDQERMWRTKKQKVLLEAVRDKKALPKEYQMIFTSYDQIQGDLPAGYTHPSRQIRAQMKRQHQPPPDGVRMEMLRAIAPNAMFILDESHLASGDSIRAWRISPLLAASRAAYYSSATYAKRPDNIGIYFKTTLSRAAHTMQDLTDAMTQGGVPLQQAVSSMLSDDGLYMRRERDFGKSTYRTHINVDTKDRDRELADTYTSGLRRILGLSNDIKDLVDALNEILRHTGTQLGLPSAPRLSSTNFAAIIHNLVSQYLLSIKSKAAVERALYHIDGGPPPEDGTDPNRQKRRVVVTVQNTMESAIEALEQGNYPISFNGLLMRYLDRQRTLTSGKGPTAQTFYISEKPNEELAQFSDQSLEGMMMTAETAPDGTRVPVWNKPVIEEYFRRRANALIMVVKEHLKTLDLGDMPISPIDYMRDALEDAGIKTVELTGRSKGVRKDGTIYTISGAEHSKKAQIEYMKQFNFEDAQFLIMNSSGSTGISLHSSIKFKNQEQRAMLIVQPHLAIDDFMQSLWRIDRTGQQQPPFFEVLQTAIPAELRPAAVLERKMASLNANTTSNAKNEMKKQDSDIFNQYGDETVWRYLAQDIDFAHMLDYDSLLFDRRGNLRPLNALDIADGELVAKVTGRLAILPTAQGEAFWEWVNREYDVLITYLNENGMNALIAQHEDLQAETLESSEYTAGNPNPTSAFDGPSTLEKVKAKMGKMPRAGNDVLLETGRVAREVTPGLQAQWRTAQREFYDAEERRRITLEAENLTPAEEVAAEAFPSKEDYVRSLRGDDDKLKNWRERMRNARNLIDNSLRLLGDTVHIHNARGLDAYGGVVEAKLDLEAPLTPSKQKFTVWVNSNQRQIHMAATQMAEDAVHFDRDHFVEAYEENAQRSNEFYIITGNLLAASVNMGQVQNARIITYTTDKGDVRQGYLMPVAWNPRTASGLEAVTDGQHFQQLLDDGKTVVSRNQKVSFLRRTPGVYEMRVPAGRAVGLAFWGDQRLRNLMNGNNFEQKGSNFVAKFGSNKVDAVFARVTGADPDLATPLFFNRPVTPGGNPTPPTPLMASVPIARDYWNEDVKPLVTNIKATATEILNTIAKVLTPTYGVNKDVLDKVHGLMGDRNQVAYIVDRTGEAFEKMFNSMPRADLITFVDRVKQGEAQPTPELQEAADFIRKVDTQSWEALSEAAIAAGMKNNPVAWLENHYRVMWKTIPNRPDGPEGSRGGRSPLRGSRGMAKQHTLDTMSDGIDAGGIPFSYNPMVNLKLALADIWKYTTALKMWAWAKDNGFVSFVRGPFPKLPEGMEWIDDSIADVWFPAESGEGLVHGGKYASESGFARLLNNFLSRDLIRQTKTGRSLMWLKNATTSAELMFSLFHGVFETLETVASNIGLGLSQMYNRGLLGKDTSGLMQGMLNIIKSPASPVLIANLGSRFREMAGKPDEFWATPEGKAFLKIHPDAREMINALFAGGWKPNEVEADWKNQSVRAFMESMKNLKEGNSKNYIGAGLRAAPAAAEFMMGPLFDRFIPNLKIGQFITEMREAQRINWLRYNGRQGYYMDRQGRRYDRPTDTEIARQVWRLVEDRFGELNYDTLFWNQTFKAAMQLMFRSVTWKFGSIEAFGRAATGQGKEFIDAFKERRAPQLHRNMAWLLGIFLLTAALGTVISKVLGKHTPKNLTDYVFPRIDPHDPSVRVSIPTYFKDLVHLIHSPTGYVKASLAGWIGRVAELLANKDYYGVQIRDTDAPATKQALQVGKHAAESLLPFSIRGYRNLSANQENTIRKVGALFGINPAPRYIGQTPAEQQVEKYWKGQRTEEGVKPEQFEIQKGKRELVAQIRHGQHPNIDKAIAEGKLKPRDISALYKRASLGPLAAGIDKMSLEDAEKVYAKANPAEKAQLAGILARKRANALSRSGRTMYTGF